MLQRGKLKNTQGQGSIPSTGCQVCHEDPVSKGWSCILQVVDKVQFLLVAILFLQGLTGEGGHFRPTVQRLQCLSGLPSKELAHFIMTAGRLVQCAVDRHPLPSVPIQRRVGEPGKDNLVQRRVSLQQQLYQGGGNFGTAGYWHLFLQQKSHANCDQAKVMWLIS